jgi:putative CocE/NonD family hydrolase
MKRLRFGSEVIVAAILLMGPGAQVSTSRADGVPVAEATPPPVGPETVRLEKSVPIPMRDGIQLSTDLYFPEGNSSRHPIILVRTPYGKQGWRPGSPRGALATMFATHGYIVAIQDKRGRFESQGRYTLAIDEDIDGYDAVEWLSRQPWSNGKVGTYGCSDSGDAQVWLAESRPPALTAMIPQASGSAIGPAGGRYRYFGAFNGGAFQLAAGEEWMINSGSKVFWGPPAWLPPDKFREIADQFTARPKPVIGPEALEPLLWTLPVVDMMKRVGMTYTDWEDILRHDLADPWWAQFPYYKGSEKVDVPALFVNSWGDFGVNETLFEFNFFQTHSLSAKSRNNQFVIISPTTHCSSELAKSPTVVGQRDLGDAQKDFWNTYLKWYGHWLKGDENGITQMPHVQYYLMGLNEWRSAESWPVPGTEFRRYYLHGGGAANSRYGDGLLTTSAPQRDEPSDYYVYDPASPVPTGTGPGLPEGFFDQSSVEMRHDVLVYTSAPLKGGVEVTGPVMVRIYVSSSAKDTDFTAKLVDVYPDGRAFNLQDGILRARYREGFDKKVWMQADQVYAVDVSLDATSNYFAADHRIRLEVSSSNFPRFDRNLNTGGDNYEESVWQIAHNSVHHSKNTASYLLLPIVPNHQ